MAWAFRRSRTSNTGLGVDSVIRHVDPGQPASECLNVLCATGPSTGTARSGALRPAAVFGAVGGMEAVRLQGEPGPDGESPAGATGVDLLRQEPGKQVSRMTRVSGIDQRSAQPCQPKHRSRGPALAAGSTLPIGSPM